VAPEIPDRLIRVRKSLHGASSSSASSLVKDGCGGAASAHPGTHRVLIAEECRPALDRALWLPQPRLPRPDFGSSAASSIVEAFASGTTGPSREPIMLKATEDEIEEV